MEFKIYLKKNDYGNYPAMVNVAQLVGASSHKPRGHRFNTRAGYMPGLWVWYLVGVHAGGRQLADECFSLTLIFLSL